MKSSATFSFQIPTPSANTIMLCLIGLFILIGLIMVGLDLLHLPSRRASAAIKNVAKARNRRQEDSVNGFFNKIASWLEVHVIRLPEIKRADLAVDLTAAGMDMTPERYKAQTMVTSLIVCAIGLPFLFVWWPGFLIILFIAVVLYINADGKVGRQIKSKREAIDYELSHLVFTIEKTLKHNRDVLYMLETYRDNAGPDLKKELEITTADMRSGNYELAITHLEARVGTPLMSDVCRGLISIMRGDETREYWANLEIKLTEIHRNKLRARARMIPKRVNRRSMVILVIFMLTFLCTILVQVIDSLKTVMAAA